MSISCVSLRTYQRIKKAHCQLSRLEKAHILEGFLKVSGEQVDNIETPYHRRRNTSSVLSTRRATTVVCRTGREEGVGGLEDEVCPV